MEKTRKQKSINKILTLMLAFVMVFTGMGIGSWGVDEAWADDTQSPAWDGTISKPENGDGTTESPYQISTAAELAWFAGLVNGTLTDGTVQNTAANAVLTANIDLGNKEWTPIGHYSTQNAQTKTRKYKGTFDGQGNTIKHLKISSEENYNALFGYCDYATLRNLNITNAEVKGDRNCGILLAYNNVSNITNCSVLHSNLTVTQTAGIICGSAGSKVSTFKNCFAKDSSITANFAAKTDRGTVNKGNVGGLVGDAYNAAIENCYVAETTITNTSDGTTAWGILCGRLYTKGTIQNCYYQKKADGKNDYDTAYGEEKTAEWFKSAEAVTALGDAYTRDNDINDGYPFLNVEAAIDKSELAGAISEAQKIDRSKYHAKEETDAENVRTEDRYNGKDYSANGFWTDMQAIITAAQAVYDDSKATQDDVEAATATLDQTNPDSELSKAIANLVPTTQINPTALHEAVTTEWVWNLTFPDDPTVWDKAKFSTYWKCEAISKDNCTAASWTPYAEAKENAETLLASLFDENGNATDANVNDAEGNAQKEADSIAAEANPQQLVRKSSYDSYYETYQQHKEEAGVMLTQYDPKKLEEESYTADSWKTYTDAYQALKDTYEYKLLGGTKADFEALVRFITTRDVDNNPVYQTDALVAAYNRLKSTEAVTVSLTYVNNLTAAYPAVSGGTDAYRAQNITLSDETNVYGALTEAGITYASPDAATLGTIQLPKIDGASTPKDSLTTPYLSVFVNDEFRGIYKGAASTAAVNLKNGDKVTVSRVLQPYTKNEASSGLTSTSWSWSSSTRMEYQDSLAVITLTANDDGLKVGDKLNISASVHDAYGNNIGEEKSAKGLTLFVSEANDDESITSPSKNTGETTDANGKASYTFTKSGWYTIALYDIQEDDQTKFDVYQNYTMGTYHSLVAGDIALIYVDAAENEAALIAQYRTENLAKAKAFFNNYQAYDFADGYYDDTFKAAYEELIKNQNAAASFENLMQQFDTDYANLQKLAKENAADYEGTAESIREKLKYIPDDLTALDASYTDAINEIRQAYAGFAAPQDKAREEYQKRFFTSKEIEKLDEIAKLNTADFKQLAEVTVSVEGFRDLPLAVGIGQTGGSSLHGWPQLTWSMTPNLDGSVSTPIWANLEYTDKITATAGDHVYVRAYLTTSDEKYWMVWSVDGENWNLSQPQTLKSYHGEMVSGYYLADYQVPKDIEENALTMKVKMISKAEYEEIINPAETPEQIEAAKTAALESLKADYDKYNQGSYTEKNREKLKEAYDAGQKAINEAETSQEAAEARKTALAAMAAIPAEGSSSGENPGTKPSYDSGKTVGSVSVLIENTTYSGGAFTGTIASGTYSLGENDSMMTVILKALEQAGYSWDGTVGSGKDKLADYSITYLSSIKKGEKSLGEFDGNSKSGWMGTLNDWFVNEGFANFTYKNGGIESGDEIHVMFTMNYGEDLGGSWNNNNTKLKGLTVSGGTLAPTFSGSQTEYTLMIKGKNASITVKPEAANKNYQARIFLNAYNKDSARYKTTETISVKSGDVLYVGVGESGWPTMNSSASGTKYTIKVVSDSDSSTVEEMLNALKTITYSNYRAEKASVESARAAYNALSDEAKKNVTAAELKKLTDAEAQVKFYTEIDDAKAKLNALTDSSSSSQAREALSAYNKLTDEQKKYITQADVAKFNELAKKYSLSGIAGSAEMPESEVETTGKTGDAITTSPAEVKMSGTTAAVTIKADNQKEILKQAKEKKSAQVVLTVAEADAKGAEKYELSLEKSFLQSLLKDTTAKLVVKTPMGQKTYDREALQKLVDEATTAVIKAEINKDNLDQKTEEPEVDAKALTAKLTPVARSAKTAKKNVKVTVSLDSQDKEILSQLKEAGYTVKYRFYRSTKKSAGYKSTVTKKTATYTNTSGKKGTKYFYKVQVRVYDENGKLVAKTALKQCKYATRTWSK